MKNIISEQRKNAMIAPFQNIALKIDRRRLSGPLLAAFAILLSAVIAVQEFDLPMAWTSISAAAGIGLAGLWLI